VAIDNALNVELALAHEASNGVDDGFHRELVSSARSDVGHVGSTQSRILFVEQRPFRSPPFIVKLGSRRSWNDLDDPHLYPRSGVEHDEMLLISRLVRRVELYDSVVEGSLKGSELEDIERSPPITCRSCT